MPSRRPAPQPEPDRTETEQIGRLLLRIARTWRPDPGPMGEAPGTAQQYLLLVHLFYVGPRSITELASDLRVTKSTATTRTRRLEDAGLIRRTSETDDRRMVRISLTPAGRRLLQRKRGERAGKLKQMLAPLSATEQTTFLRLLRRIDHAPSPSEHRDIAKL